MARAAPPRMPRWASSSATATRTVVNVEETTRDALRIALFAAAGRTWPVQFLRFDREDSYSHQGGAADLSTAKARLAELYHERASGVLVITYPAEINGLTCAVFEGYRRKPPESAAVAVPIARRLLSFKWDYKGEPFARPAPREPTAAVPGGTPTRRRAIEAGLMTPDGQWTGRVPKRLRQARQAEDNDDAGQR
jgi:hypothetical protein